MNARKCTTWRRKAYERIAARDGLTCYICGCGDRKIVRKAGTWTLHDNSGRYSRVHITSHLELEHVVPLSEGGTNEDSNLKLACHGCHKAKTTSERSARLKGMFAEWRASQ